MKKLIWIGILIGSVCFLLCAQEAIVVDEAGNVGIGTGTPTARLEVNGPIKAQVTVKGRDGKNTEIIRDIMEALCPVGTILPFAGTVPPDGWLLCNGKEVYESEYPALFSVINRTFGKGNGSNSFNIPNLQGQFLRGVSSSTDADPDVWSRTANGTGQQNAPGSTQWDALQDHYHNYTDTYNTSRHVEGKEHTGADNNYMQETKPSYGVSGANVSYETRPRNIYVNYIIKY